MYEVVDKRFEVNIAYYLKKSIEDIKDDSKYKKKASAMFYLFKYILYFDNVIECNSVRNLITEINTYRKEKLELIDDDFEVNFYNLLKDDLIAKKKYIDSFDNKNFFINYIKINKEGVFDARLDYKLKFSKLYSEYAINKVFNSKDIKEQRLFVTYPLVTVKILQDVIKGNFKKEYLVSYSLSLKDKPKKKKRILTIIDNDIVKEKLALKISYGDYINNKDEIYEFTRNGYRIALELDSKVELTEELLVLFKIFSYLITDDVDIYNNLKDKYNLLYIPKGGE